MKLFSQKLMAALGLMLGVALVSAVPAMADLTDAPSWWGADDGRTVSLSWHFDTGASDPVPDFKVVPDWYTGETWDIFGEGGSADPQWYSTGGGRSGVWGYDNPAGESWGIFDVLIDNEPLMPLKLVWFQMEVYLSGGALPIDGGLEVDYEGYEVVYVDAKREDLGKGWWRFTGEAKILPQPPDELFWLDIIVPQGATVVIDQMHIGTHCVPEPASLLLLGSGLMGLIGSGIRKRKSLSIS